MTRLAVQAGLVLLFALYMGARLIQAHIDPSVDDVDYTFQRELKARRGGIFDANDEPLVKSIPIWEYRLDPVALTNRVVKQRGVPPRPMESIVKTIAIELGLNYKELLHTAKTSNNRFNYLARSFDSDAHKVLADSTLVSGLAILDKQERQYFNGRLMSHILGSLNQEEVASSGIELKYDKDLSGVPGQVVGMKDALGHELYDKRKVSTKPVAGADIYLTLDRNLQYDTEQELKAGVAEFGAGSGWAIIMDVKTGAILSMASYPDFDPVSFGNSSEEAKLNRAVGMTFEPGSVMKVITAAAAFDAGFVKPTTMYNTKQHDENYYKLPGDGSHVWEEKMSVADAIVHSSNIVIGKLAYDFGQENLYNYMRAFGFGQKTGIELPGEEYGILPNWKKWDKASWSRAGIGQFVSVTPIQLISAYQAIANDGVRMKPHIIRKIVGSDGGTLQNVTPEVIGHPIKAETAQMVREVMKPVASKDGTARRAAIKGYSVAGKTGTAQKHLPGIKGYAPGLYRASFCAMVPAEKPSIVVLVTLDFDKKALYHQGGNSSAVIFRRLTTKALEYLMIPADKPEEILEVD